MRYYRQQMKFVKVMFLHLSVSHSVHGGHGGGIPACIVCGIPACLAAGLGGGVVSQHALQVSRPTPKGKLRGLARGVSRPTPKGEVEGSGLGGSPGPHLGGLLAHTWGVSSPTPRGVSRPTPGGVSQHALRQTPHP